ncbi:ECM7 (YLR443W) [Zygosaccharomyces parabailii]|nr:ECM7 (YLR443W) [Zygosaccharomyces parabailii]
MQISRVRKVAMRPFENLTALESLVQWLRLISSTLIIALGLVATVGPLTSPNTLRMAQFDTRPADITQGLFQVLKHAVEVFGSTDANNGVGLTTSEIYILTAYTEGQIQNIPQFITLNIYGRCDVSFKTRTEDPGGTEVQVRNSTIAESCHRAGPDYIFDYRSVLSQLGLDIVLDYAYDKDGASTVLMSGSYNEYMSNLRNQKRNMLSLLYAVICLEACILVMTFWYYIIKGRFINPFKERFLMHSISFLSFTVFICSLTSIITLTCINYKLRNRIRNELQAFGFSYSMGNSWITCIWFMAVFVIISTLVWSGLEWCISDSQDYRDGSQNNILSYQPGVFMDQSEIEAPHDSREQDLYHTDSISNTINILRRSPEEGSDFAEEMELQDLALYSSDDSELMMQRTVKPSSTMQF